MGSREDYDTILHRKQIRDILKFIPELSYSKKLSIIIKLSEQFSSNTINYALQNYQDNYINMGKVQLKRIDTMLLHYCKNYKERGVNG